MSTLRSSCGQTQTQSARVRYPQSLFAIVTGHERAAPVSANVQLQLFSYYLTDALDRPIDKLRNLTKSALLNQLRD